MGWQLQRLGNDALSVELREVVRLRNPVLPIFESSGRHFERQLGISKADIHMREGDRGASVLSAWPGRAQRGWLSCFAQMVWARLGVAAARRRVMRVSAVAAGIRVRPQRLALASVFCSNCSTPDPPFQ